MKIETVTSRYPTLEVSNECVVGQIVKKKRDVSDEEIERIKAVVGRSLSSIGSRTRYWTRSGEKPFNLTIEACEKALDSLEDRQIDMVIYASVFSFLVEPANANLIARSLGLRNAEAVDITAACDGWMKAAKVADALIKSGAYNRILVVNSEFSLQHKYAIRPELFRFTEFKQLAWRLPIFTIGEGVTATVFSSDDGNPWQHWNQTDNEYVDLCSVTQTWNEPEDLRDRFAKDGHGLFTSHAMDLSRAGIPLGIQAFQESGIKPLEVDHFFTHASSTKDWKDIAQAVGLSNQHFDIHPRRGNLVSASVPAALADALEDGVLRRGDKVATLTVSAGMTASVVQYVF